MEACPEAGDFTRGKIILCGHRITDYVILGVEDTFALIFKAHYLLGGIVMYVTALMFVAIMVTETYSDTAVKTQ